MPPERPGSGFAMGSMVAALPDYRSPMYGVSQSQQRFPLTATSPQLIHQQHQNLPPFGGQAPGYNVSFQQQYGSSHPHGQPIPLTSPQYFHQQQPGQSARSAITGPIQTQFSGAPFYPGQPHVSQQFGGFPSSYGQVNPSQHNLPGSSSRSFFCQSIGRLI